MSNFEWSVLPKELCDDSFGTVTEVQSAWLLFSRSSLEQWQMRQIGFSSSFISSSLIRSFRSSPATPVVWSDGSLPGREDSSADSSCPFASCTGESSCWSTGWAAAVWCSSFWHMKKAVTSKWCEINKRAQWWLVDNTGALALLFGISTQLPRGKTLVGMRPWLLSLLLLLWKTPAQRADWHLNRKKNDRRKRNWSDVKLHTLTK